MKIDNNNLEQLKSLEWLETNGLGGWAMGTLAGMNTRKYHSWLSVSYNPPTDRSLLIPKLTESLSSDSEYHELDSNDFGNAIHPKGWGYLNKFDKDLYPKWEFKTPLGTLSRELIMPWGENVTILKYKFKGKKTAQFHVRPFHVFRDVHGLYNQNGYDFSYYPSENALEIKENSTGNQAFITCSVSTAIHLKAETYNNINLETEKDRGYDYIENWATAGYLDISLKEDEEIYLVLSTEKFDIRQASKLFDKEVQRRVALTKKAKTDFEKDLLIAADQFIVKRGDSKSIIAGYPWFTDWGRDTMISLPGLTLTTKRYDEAYQILLSFKEVVNHGLIPNRFVEIGGVPEYNTVDATLWFVVAIYQYHKASKRPIEEFLPAIQSILKYHIEGTLFNIKMDEDGLLEGGEEGWQLTWMDAKLDGVVVTPRRGKAVEINALWYNLLKICSYFQKEHDFGFDCEVLAKQCKKSFNKLFIKPNGALYDVIEFDGTKDDSVRPNQAFAGGLPFKVITKKTAQAVVEEIESELLTPHGLRTLNQSREDYKGCCNGDLHSRDYAYHQGTVWMWLWGAYCDTKLYVDKVQAKKDIKKQLVAIEKHFYQNGIGSLSEVFDGDAPHNPGGCPAQAWSVAEVLRVFKLVE